MSILRFRAVLFLACMAAPDAGGQTIVPATWQHWPGFVAPGIKGVHVVDLDGDGRLEVLATGASLFAVARFERGEFRIVRKLPLLAGSALVSPVQVVHPDGGPDFRVVTSTFIDGVHHVVALGGADLELQSSISVPSLLRVVQVADVDGDGSLDVLGKSNTDSYIMDLESGFLKWQSPHNSRIRDLTAVQMDADPQLEVVLSVSDASGGGRVFDGATGEEQLTGIAGLPSRFISGNFDDDPSTTELASGSGDFASIYATSPSFALIAHQDVRDHQMSRALDFNGDGVDELAIGVDPLGTFALDVADWSEVFSYLCDISIVFERPLDFDAGQLDDDASIEFAVGTQTLGSGSDTLRIVDVDSGELEFSLPEDQGPFSSVLAADIEGDGRLEVILVTRKSPDFGSRIRVFDAESGTLLRSQPDAINNGVTGTSPILLANLDDDPQLEIVVGGDSFSTPQFSAFDGISLDRQWNQKSGDMDDRPAAMALADVNSDGKKDVLAVLRGVVRAIDGRTGTTLWSSSPLSEGPFAAHALVANLDADPAEELVVAGATETFVFDLATRLVQVSYSNSAPVVEQRMEGTGSACRLVQFQSDRLVRRHCNSGIVDSERMYAVPSIISARALSDSHGDLVLSDGQNVFLQQGENVRGVSDMREFGLGADGGGAVFFDRGEPAAIFGGELGLHRIDFAFDRILRNGFE